MMEWQSIETAKRTEHGMLIYLPGEYLKIQISYGPNEDGLYEEWVNKYGFEDSYPYETQPTKWMPLPPEPKE